MYFRQPRYFTDFHCIGGDCPDNCCHGWQIDWMAQEVEKLKTAPNMSQELRGLIDKSFIPNSDLKGQYQIEFNERGNCPCLTEDGFCRIQRELGAEYLSKVCMVYPRHYILANDIMYRYCNMSCYEVMKKLLNDEKSTDFVNVSIKGSGELHGVVNDTPELLSKHPELKYRGELLEFFYEVIADKKRSVEDSLILGALAAQKLSQYAEDGNYELISDALTAFRKQFHDSEQLRKIEAIKPNYNIKLEVLTKAFESLENKLVTLSGLVDNTGKLNIDLYLQGEQRLAEAYKDRPFYLRNIALNLLLELKLPFQFKDKTIFENYSIFVTAFALFKLNAIAESEFTKRNEAEGRVSVRDGIGLNFRIKIDTDSYVHKACALISRVLCHTPNNAKALLQLLHDKKMLSPAYLALLVK